MTCTTRSTHLPQEDRHTMVFVSAQALPDGSTPDSSAAITQARLPSAGPCCLRSGSPSGCLSPAAT
jgi:hypothetical protein